MPEHVHLLVSEPHRGTPSSVLQVLKQRVSRTLRRGKTEGIAGQLCLRFAAAEETVAWAPCRRRFYDFNVWSAKKLAEKLAYMHENPVKRKLVLQAKDWPWSSWSHCARCEEGMIAIDG